MDTITAFLVFVVVPAVAMGALYWISSRFRSRHDVENDDQ
jgi:hypothetical protein